MVAPGERPAALTAMTGEEMRLPLSGPGRDGDRRLGRVPCYRDRPNQRGACLSGYQATFRVCAGSLTWKMP